MTPIPPNTATRLKVFYHGPFGSHTMLFHKAAGATDAAFVSGVRAVLTEMADCMWNGATFDRAELASAGSNVFGPYTPWAPIASATGADPTTYDSPSTFIMWGGRAADSGVRVKLYLFEVREHPVHNMRYEYGELGRIDQVTDALDLNSEVIGTIEGSGAVWYTYANVGENDYLTHRARRS